MLTLLRRVHLTIFKRGFNVEQRRCHLHRQRRIGRDGDAGDLRRGRLQLSSQELPVLIELTQRVAHQRKLLA